MVVEGGFIPRYLQSFAQQCLLGASNPPEDERRIDIAVSTSAADDGQTSLVEITVTDNGPGVKPNPLRVYLTWVIPKKPVVMALAFSSLVRQ